MSNYVKALGLRNKFLNSTKKSKFIECSLIEYNEQKYKASFLILMEKGYKEMAEINLEIANIPFECENANINEYENWLCGV
ncbi:hypothetical protein [Clostridium gasigenes]|uniref:CopG family transcriptional regulator / antitoxin EndoAI n=1 Tax=Clostridium gasigenes TaxID=94869 RepID=A0A1H0QQR8_9CLOT|nr:hypothetical protein [Clostridium gasigenes]MBB6625132.1 hypothetical protein [Clostridium gasigenes]MBB6716608.1 hypothetical protein [Clostridium gasigenes]MBU3089097.1 hypothetical protein [Clostridium gasigenes]MBU3104438.1 hypothetical protein [Clostridium gasigenes]MBU3108111.1 hypothetical protein [Clostridium gasigenes]